jgi:hypothetical protein
MASRFANVNDSCSDAILAKHNTRSRTHLGLDKDSPAPRAVIPPSAGCIVAISEVNGLHPRYVRAAA